MHFVLIAAATFTFFYAFHRTWRGTMEFFPTIGWVMLMVAPFCIEYPLFGADSRDFQAQCLLFMLLLIFAGDLGAMRFTTVIPAVPDVRMRKHAYILACILGSIFVVLSASHLANAPSIPLFDDLFTSEKHSVVVHARNIFSRDMGTHPLVRYIYNFSTCILAVPAMLLFFAYRYRACGVMLLAWIGLYSVAGTAKSPLAMVLVVTLLGILILARMDIRRKMMRVLMVGGLAGLALLAALDMSGPDGGILKNLPQKYAIAKADADTQRTLKPDLGDYVRVAHAPGETRPWFWRKVDYALYRIFFTPIEVSGRWYEYFYHYPTLPPHNTRLIHDSRTNQMIHPANAVGRWAYFERFPNNYTQEVYAYASVDADARGRYGAIGILLCGVILVGLRLWLAAFNDIGGMTRGAFYAAGLGLISYLPSSASIQAIVIPQGLGVLAGLLLLLHVAEKRRKPPILAVEGMQAA